MIISGSLKQRMLGFKAGATIITKQNESIVGLIFDKDDINVSVYTNTNLSHDAIDNFSDIKKINLSEELYYKILRWTQEEYLILPVEELIELTLK